MIHESQTAYDKPSTVDEEIDVKIKSDGYLIKRPEYWQNKLGPKSKKYSFSGITTGKVREFNRRSAESLARINAKYGHRTGRRVVRTVDGGLCVHSMIINE